MAYGTMSLRSYLIFMNPAAFNGNIERTVLRNRQVLNTG
jgi:hypothetical protein